MLSHWSVQLDVSTPPRTHLPRTCCVRCWIWSGSGWCCLGYYHVAGSVNHWHSWSASGWSFHFRLLSASSESPHVQESHSTPLSWGNVTNCEYTKTNINIDCKLECLLKITTKEWLDLYSGQSAIANTMGWLNGISMMWQNTWQLRWHCFCWWITTAVMVIIRFETTILNYDSLASQWAHCHFATKSWVCRRKGGRCTCFKRNFTSSLT